MADNPFYRLAPFIQDYIYKNKWIELREVQVDACSVIFDSDDNLLLSSGTASGKTEAAFLPCLTLICEHPPTSVGILYISPLKALINDQFLRLDELLEEAHVPVCKWHGDVSQSVKEKLLREPRGVLQITPESLEALLMNKKQAVAALFCDLRFVVIDEVHCFMSSDRGTQLLCLLERIQRLAGVVPRRIGLSATLGDVSQAERWLCSGTERRCATPEARGSGAGIRLALEHFFVPDERHQHKKTQNTDDVRQLQEEELTGAYFDYLYHYTLGKRCIIYANSRGEIESTIATLKRVASSRGTDDVYLIHHGSLSAPIREYAEHAMKTSETPLVTGATLTLELGIDIGALERVMQLDSPHFVSCFLQRLGRTGRRGAPGEMWFACKEEPTLPNDSIIRQFGWNLIETIAVIQLYLEERWIEPLSIPRCPMSLLYHQTMSIMASAGEISPAALAQTVLTLTPFRSISQQDYAVFLRHLLSIGHLEKSERGGLIVGLAGERIINSFRFYAVFETPEEFSVRHEGEEIGTLQYRLPIGERFALAGRTWEVTDLDNTNKMIFVKAINDRSRTDWTGLDGPPLHTKLLKKMREVVKSEEVYRYLGPNAVKRLAELRAFAANTGIADNVVVHLGGDSYGVFPWLGTRAMTTLIFFLRQQGFFIDAMQGYEPYCCVVKTDEPASLYATLRMLRTERLDARSLRCGNAVIEGKFNEFIPRELLEKQFIEDFIDVDDMQKGLTID
ncbi:MAG: DEAD/DEAH box helicase [Clostridia bacterium]|nr:DEAD/DEAH box helicase [Clostridia bacterium]